MRAVFAIIAALALIIWAPARLVAAPSQTSISGGGLPAPIRFTAVDEDAFFRRINVPPKLEEAPATAGRSYTLTSPYWDTVLRGERSARAPAEAGAQYFPEGGFARARQNGGDVWLVLDLRQRAIIDRYARLGEMRVLSPDPGELEVLAAAVRAGEQIGIQIGTNVLAQHESARLWESLAGGAKPRPFSSLAPSDLAALKAAESNLGASTADESAELTWVLFSLAEGRSVQLLYDPSRGLLADFTSEEWYSIPDGWLTRVLSPGDFPPRPVAIPQERGNGSPLWWPAAGLGGVSLIAVAVWLRRRGGRQRASGG